MFDHLKNMGIAGGVICIFLVGGYFLSVKQQDIKEAYALHMESPEFAVESSLKLKQLYPVLEKIEQKTVLPSIELQAVRQPTTPYDSKFGGIPYLPPGFDYPVSEETGKPLKLLAQLNFQQFPPIEGFPTKGILQFYIACDEFYGADFDLPTKQKKYRVIYHEAVLGDVSMLQEPPDLSSMDEEIFPFTGTFKLIGKSADCSMPPSDFRFNALFQQFTASILGKKIESAYDLDEEVFNVIYDKLQRTGHRFGGYPFFTQTDPREYNQERQNHTVLLLQIDSDGGNDDVINWGDCGVANFFIKPTDLANRDFSNVIYHWDCY